MRTFDDMLSKKLQDEEFRKEYESNQPEMDVIRAKVDASISAFTCDSTLDKMEDGLILDEKRILSALKRAEKQKHYTLDEAWKKLGL